MTVIDIHARRDQACDQQPPVIPEAGATAGAEEVLWADPRELIIGDNGRTRWRCCDRRGDRHRPAHLAPRKSRAGGLLRATALLGYSLSDVEMLVAAADKAERDASDTPGDDPTKRFISRARTTRPSTAVAGTPSVSKLPVGSSAA